MATSAAVAESLLAFVGYRGAIDVPAGALAHVDKRLVEIARALAVRPAVLALDEPAAGLDAADTALIDKVLRELAAVGIAIILVEHDMELVMGVSSHVIVLDAGAKIAEGTPRASRSRARGARSLLGAGEQAERGRERRFLPAHAPLLTVQLAHRPVMAPRPWFAMPRSKSPKASWSRSSAPTARARPR